DSRDAGRGVHRLLGLARVHPYADPRRRMAVPEGGDRDAGLHRLGLTLAHRGRLVLPGVAVGLVVLLFGLLLWKLVRSSGGDLAAAANRGGQPRAPGFTPPRLDPRATVAL